MGIQAIGQQKLLTRAEVHDTYGIPVRFLERAPSTGQGPKFAKIGRLVFYRVKDIEAWIEENVCEGK